MNRFRLSPLPGTSLSASNKVESMITGQAPLTGAEEGLKGEYYIIAKS